MVVFFGLMMQLIECKFLMKCFRYHIIIQCRYFLVCNGDTFLSFCRISFIHVEVLVFITI